MILASALDIFGRDGFAFLSRWSHVFVGITWIGLLYFFNFIQVPAYAEMEGAARNNAIDKVTSRALWWFRWAAVMTLLSGIALFLLDPKELLRERLHQVGARRRDLRRDPPRGDDVPQRVARDLAEPEDRDRQRPKRAGRR